MKNKPCEAASHEGSINKCRRVGGCFVPAHISRNLALRETLIYTTRYEIAVAATASGLSFVDWLLASSFLWLGSSFQFIARYTTL